MIQKYIKGFITYKQYDEIRHRNCINYWRDHYGRIKQIHSRRLYNRLLPKWLKYLDKKAKKAAAKKKKLEDAKKKKRKAYVPPSNDPPPV